MKINEHGPAFQSKFPADKIVGPNSQNYRNVFCGSHFTEFFFVWAKLPNLLESNVIIKQSFPNWYFCLIFLSACAWLKVWLNWRTMLLEFDCLKSANQIGLHKDLLTILKHWFWAVLCFRPGSCKAAKRQTLGV